MSKIIEAIDQELADLEGQVAGLQARITDVRALREQAAAIGGAGVSKVETEQPAPTPERTPRRPRQAPPRRTSKRTSGRAKSSKREDSKRPGTALSDAEIAELDDQVYDVLAGVGAWTSGGILFKRIKRARPTIRASVDRLVNAGRVERKGERAGTRYRVADLDEPEAIKPSPSDPEPAPEPTPSSIAPRRSQPDRATSAMRNGNRKAHEELLDRVEATVREEPGLKAGELAAKVGVQAGAIGGMIRTLSRQGRLRVEKGVKNAKHIHPATGQARESFPSDDDGCKTDTERKVVAAVSRAPVALTTSEVAANCGISEVAPVLHGLRRRGVVAMVSAEGQFPQRWELASELAEAA